MTLEGWTDEVRREIRAQLGKDKHWGRKLAGDLRLHLAIFVEPWLSWLLDGTKTIESRWSLRRTIPFERVSVGDVLLLKASSGPVVGICEVAETWFFDLEQTRLRVIRDRFGEAIAGDAEFWASVEGSRYVTLLEVREPRRLLPFSCPKRDRRGWVVLDE